MVGGDLINTVPFILVAVTAYLSTLAMYVPLRILQQKQF